MLGAVVTFVDLPTAIPYLAAIALTVRAHPGPFAELGVLALFNAIYVAPLLAIVVADLLLGAHSHGTLGAARDRIDRWAPLALCVLCAFGGTALVFDGSLA